MNKYDAAELQVALKEWLDKTEFMQTDRLPVEYLGMHRADVLRMQLERCLRLFDEALPKFNWGASFLDANAIQLLNEVPREVRALLGDVQCTRTTNE